MDLILLAVAFVVILAGAELFTNGIEWFGRKLQLGQGAVGSVLAAVGTALPETMIPIIAIAFGSGEHTDEVGIGAILGAPFMLATLAMFVTGAGVIAFRRRRYTGTRMVVDTTVLVHDIRFFVLAYAIAIASAFLPPELSMLKVAVAIGLIGIYAYYVRQHFKGAGDDDDDDELSPLRFHRIDRRGHRLDPHEPRMWIVSLQVVVALGFIIGGAYLFVDAVNSLASALDVSEILLALVIAPIATELPEKFNSLIWVRQGKDTLAMGNITGAMVFQSAIPVVVALLLAPDGWHVGPDTRIAFLSAGIAFLAVAAIFIPMWRRARLDGPALLVGGLLYLVYLIIVILAVAGLLPGT
jgi:cation:H+ antiporter